MKDSRTAWGQEFDKNLELGMENSVMAKRIKDLYLENLELKQKNLRLELKGDYNMNLYSDQKTMEHIKLLADTDEVIYNLWEDILVLKEQNKAQKTYLLERQVKLYEK